MVTGASYIYRGDLFAMPMNGESLCYTPETSMIVYVNYTLIKKKDYFNFSRGIILRANCHHISLRVSDSNQDLMLFLSHPTLGMLPKRNMDLSTVFLTS